MLTELANSEKQHYRKAAGFFISEKSAFTMSHLSSRIQRIVPEIGCTPLYYGASGIYCLRLKSATIALTKPKPPITKLTHIIPGKGINMAVTSKAPIARDKIRTAPLFR